MKKDYYRYSHNSTEYVGPHVLAYWIKSSIRNDVPMKKKRLIDYSTDNDNIKDKEDKEENED
jgi:hypothetical protein